MVLTSGGRNYVVRFDKPVVASDIEEKLAKIFKTKTVKTLL
jgi:SecD/SecF fusion protein